MWAQSWCEDLSESQQNPRRFYYGCPKEPKEKERCSYWEWCNLTEYNKQNPVIAAEVVHREVEVNLVRNNIGFLALEMTISNLKCMANVVVWLCLWLVLNFLSQCKFCYVYLWQPIIVRKT